MALQRELAARIALVGEVPTPQRVAGVDAAFEDESVVGACCVWDLAAQRVVEEHVVRVPLRFPYVPGLLSFREGEALVEVLRKVETHVDALLFDGAGIAHPRGLGIAAHLGLFVEVPTVGVAKSRLCGTHDEPGLERGSRALLLDGEGRRIGTVLRSRTRVKPLWISPGNGITQDGAVSLVEACLTRFRLPEPTRQADLLSKRAKRSR
ncbi:MAG: endonuclease V [Planctomycetes bacterium]|nr:endonuclease V [Planctomycetota bacterium]MCB9890904.1 endonuclease V [Planctomycetota bacterium]